MTSDPVIISIVNRLQRFPELAGAVIGYEGDGYSRVVSYGVACVPASARVAVVIEKIELSDPVALDELKLMAAESGGVMAKGLPPSIITNKSRLGPELLGAGLSCGLTVVSAAGLIAGAAAEVPTGGASTFLVLAAWSGLLMGGIQCINGLVRVGAIVAAPDGNSLQRWDSSSAYTGAMLVVDAIGVVSAVGALPAAIRNLWAVLARQSAFVKSGLTFEKLKAMNRAERLATITKLWKEASKTKEGALELTEAATRAQTSAPGAGSYSGLSVRGAQKLMGVISQETARRISWSLSEVVGNSANIAVSGTPARFTGSASGSVNYLINLIELVP